jgi:hypothetical protein
MTTPKINVPYLKAQLEQRKLFAEFFIASALTGHAKQRKIFHGVDGPEFTDEEKINEAMNTARRHIEIFGELMEHLPSDEVSK